MPRASLGLPLFLVLAGPAVTGCGDPHATFFEGGAHYAATPRDAPTFSGERHQRGLFCLVGHPEELVVRVGDTCVLHGHAHIDAPTRMYPQGDCTLPLADASHPVTIRTAMLYGASDVRAIRGGRIVRAFSIFVSADLVDAPYGHVEYWLDAGGSADARASRACDAVASGDPLPEYAIGLDAPPPSAPQSQSPLLGDSPPEAIGLDPRSSSLLR